MGAWCGRLARLTAPATGRNREPILQALRPHLPASGLVLEVASGTGEHVAYFATALPGLHWQPTEPDAERRASIDDWTAGLANVSPAMALDAAAPDWPMANADVVLCCNMIHIAPWSCTEGLVAGAARVLPGGGLLALYGPFRQAGQPMVPSNAAFDVDLRSRDPAWGLRALEDVAALALRHRFASPVVEPMPANNLLVLFRRV